MSDSAFRKWVASIVSIILILGIFSFIRTNTQAISNRDGIDRLEQVEGEVRDIINQGLLDCPNRAKARHILRLAILADPDTTAELRSVVESDFKEIPCSATVNTTPNIPNP